MAASAGYAVAYTIGLSVILAKNKHLFRWSSLWSWGLYKQAKLLHLGHRKPARIHWKADATKTSHCLCGFWSRSIIGTFFFFENEQGELNEFLYTKIEEEDIGNIWLLQDGATCHTAEATLDVLCPVFADRIISCRADVVWPPRRCDLTLLDYYCWDKPETIDALKDIIREANTAAHNR